MAGASVELQNLLGSPSYLASEISSNWTQWKTDKSTHEKRMAEVIAYVYATSTRETENAANDWDNSTNVPKLAHIYDTLKANYLDGLMPHNEWLSLENEKEMSRDQRNRILAFLKTKHRLKNLRGTVEKLLDDWVLTGNCFSSTSYQVETHLNPLTEAQEVVYQGPEVSVISPFDIVFNLRAPSFVSTPKIIRTVYTLGELARELEENPDLRYDAEAVQQLMERRNSLRGHKIEDIDKLRQIQMDGFGSYGEYMQGSTVELLHFYGDIYDLETGQLYKNYVVTVADRDIVLRRKPLNTWSGRPHIHHCAWRTRPNNLWGQGPLDTLVGMQYRMNHLENARADAFDEMLFGDLIFQGDVEVRQNEDGSVTYFAPEGGNVRRLAPDTTVLNADFQITGYEARMEMFAGSPREAAGFRTPGEKTKFEVARLENAASRLFQHKMTRFEIEQLENIVNSEIEVTRMNLTGKDLVRVDDPDAGVQDFITITRDDLMFNGRVIPIGARHFARQAQLASDLLQFQQSALQDPQVAQHFPSKKLAQTWERVLGVERFELYEEFGRIPEQMEQQRMMQVAQRQLELENEASLQEMEGNE